MASPLKNEYLADQSPLTLRLLSNRSLANTFPALLPLITSTTDTLDIGCGPGSLTLDFARAAPQGSATGLDVSPAALAAANTAARTAGISNARWIEGNVHDLTKIFSAGDGEAGAKRFDLVHAHQVLQYVRDPVHALRQMRAVTRTGGHVAVREWDMGSLAVHPLSLELVRWREIRARAAQVQGAEMDAGRRLLAWAVEAGWKGEEVQTMATTWCSGGLRERAVWGRVMAELTRSAQYSMVEEEDEEDEGEVRETLAKGWEDWSKIEGAWLGVLHGEIICKVSG